MRDALPPFPRGRNRHQPLCPISREAHCQTDKHGADPQICRAVERHWWTPVASAREDAGIQRACVKGRTLGFDRRGSCSRPPRRGVREHSVRNRKDLACLDAHLALYRGFTPPQPIKRVIEIENTHNGAGGVHKTQMHSPRHRAAAAQSKPARCQARYPLTQPRFQRFSRIAQRTQVLDPGEALRGAQHIRASGNQKA